MSWAQDLLNSFTKELDGDELLAACGATYPSQLRLAAQNILVGVAIDESCRQLKVLIDTSHGKMSTARTDRTVGCWRRFYTDACILLSLAEISSSSFLQAIGSLDRAIIIAGAAGRDRLDLIHRMIKMAQRECSVLSFNTITAPSTGASTAENDIHVNLSSSKWEVPSLSTPPSFSSFQTKYSQLPFILRGFANDWPALSQNPWSSPQYLRSIAGPGRIVPVEVGRDYRCDDWEQTLMSWDEFLNTIGLEGLAPDTTSSDVLYLAQYNLFLQFPELRDDICVPDYVYSSPSAANYRPPNNEEQLIINTWLGPKGTMSPAHTDPYHNIYVQIVGHKTVWLAPPSISQSMCSYRLCDQMQNHSPSMANTSRLDVFADIDDRWQDDHSDFWSNVVPKAMSATLGPGDLLYFPAGWWHAMRSETPSFSVSMWF